MKQETIVIKNLRKEYKLYNSQKDKLKEIMLPNQIKHTKKVVIDDISISVNKGQIVGILGKNGAGKSTLLKMITGVLTPTNGEIIVNGKISSLLELGTAFNMELTGYDNIFLHGQINGLSNAEIESQINDIIRFADIGDFLYQPVKTYSSGMFARLAFSAAIHIKPEILLVDEVLSVGDLRFQEKSIEKMKSMVRSGCTVLFVTHSLSAVRHFCNRAIWLEDGKIKRDGTVREVTEAYEKHMKQLEQPTIDNISINEKVQIDYDKTIQVCNVVTDRYNYFTGDDIIVKVLIKHNNTNSEFGVGFIIRDEKAQIITILNTAREDMTFTNNESEITLVIKNNCFGEGRYDITVSICDKDILYSYDMVENICCFEVEVEKNINGTRRVDGLYICEHKWIY